MADLNTSPLYLYADGTWFTCMLAECQIRTDFLVIIPWAQDSMWCVAYEFCCGKSNVPNKMPNGTAESCWIVFVFVFDTWVDSAEFSEINVSCIPNLLKICYSFRMVFSQRWYVTWWKFPAICCSHLQAYEKIVQWWLPQSQFEYVTSGGGGMNPGQAIKM